MSTPPATDELLSAYCQGFFPMADSAEDKQIKWYKPTLRGQLSITDLHIPRSLKKHMRKTDYTITINQDFEAVIKSCAEQSHKRNDTWINQTIIDLFCDLHKHGIAHSVEYRLEEELKGGLYGLTLGSIFCGESMFSRAENASKTALVHLCARLHAGGFKTLDTQFTNEHLEQFGIYEIPHEEYDKLLDKYLPLQRDFLLKDQSEKEIMNKYLHNRI